MSTIKIKARTEHLSVVLRLNDRLIMDHCRSRSMTHIFPNRVSQIQSMFPTTEFIHVRTEEKPANLCSRGLLATQLVAQRKSWFEEPSWLGSSFPDQPHTLLTKEEARQEVKSLTVLTFFPVMR